MSPAAAAVAFVGADELSVELAASCLRSGSCVRCFVPEAGRSASAALADLSGLLVCASPAEAAQDSARVIVLTDADGVDELFFGAEGIAKGLCAGAIVLIRSTLLPSQLEKKFAGKLFCLSIHH